MSFHLHTGTKLEALADSFCSKIYALPGCDPMQPETVIVQTQGMASYLRQHIARVCGIAANLDMPFVNSFAEKMILNCFADELSDNTGSSGTSLNNASRQWRRYSQQQMTMNIYRIFTTETADFPELHRYFAKEKSELRRWQLAAKTAMLFDRYQLYRYIESSSPFKKATWQSRLWQKLQQSCGKPRDHYYRKFLQYQEDIPGLPKRISVFGIGSLPPFYLEMFLALSSRTEVHFFYLTPCREDWEFLYSRQEKKRLDETGFLPDDGNSLLASWGKCGREMFSFLYSRIDRIECHEEDDCILDFASDEDDSNLHLLQQNILDSTNTFCQKAAEDTSIQILNCHTPRRQLEVLHDMLLAKFASGEASPHEVIVMAPDINDFAPLIETIFGAGALKNSYTVADRKLKNSGSISAAFMQLMFFSTSRAAVNEVLSIISTPPVARSFCLQETTAQQTIKELISDCRIRWGFDASDRQKCCGTPFKEYSWFHSIDNLMKNFAVGCEERIPGQPMLTEDMLEVFGNFVNFISRLREFQKELFFPKTLREWSDLCIRVLDNFFTPDGKEEKREHANIRRYLDDIKYCAAECGFTEMLPVDIIQDMLSGFFNTSSDRFSFLRGKITFCSLTPLRSIPAKTIAILGLDTGKFPRKDRTLNFDLMTHMPGDRSAAAEDRYLFLEALMSARQDFWCFYNGQSSRNVKKFLPSPVLDELRQYLETYFGIYEKCQQLQPFDTSYFCKESSFKSFSEINYKIAWRLTQQKSEFPTFANITCVNKMELAEKLADSPIFLHDIIAWAKHPVAHFFNNVLNIRYEMGSVFDDEEPQSLNGLEKYQLNTAFFSLSKTLDPNDMDGLYESFLDANMLPPGNSSKVLMGQLNDKLAALPAEIKRAFFKQERRQLVCKTGDCTISGVLEISPAGDTQYILNFSSYKHKLHVDALLRHCMLQSCRLAPQTTTVVYNYSDSKKEWTKAAEFTTIPQSALEDFWKMILLHYAEGYFKIQPLLPNAIFVLKNRHNFNAARNKFIPDSYAGFNDLDDPYIAKTLTVDDWQENDHSGDLPQLQNYFCTIFYEKIPWKPAKK